MLAFGYPLPHLNTQDPGFGPIDIAAGIFLAGVVVWILAVFVIEYRRGPRAAPRVEEPWYRQAA